MLRRSFCAMPGVLFAQAPPARQPWYESMRRCGQVNFNELDPEKLDIAWWLDYWTSLKLDALLLNAGGIVAFYPTAIPFHRRAKYLGTRDLFGDFTAAAKKRGIRVVARLDCNYAGEDAVKGRPEWFERGQDGGVAAHPESPWLFRTCEFSAYFSEQMPAIIREINSRYDVDGFFTNGWPGTGEPRNCYCENCAKVAGRNHPEKALEVHTRRVLAIWKQWDDTAKLKKWDSVYVGNLGGSIRAVLDLDRVSKVAGWFNADHQGRSGATPIWDCAQQGRVAQCVMKGRTITNVTGSYANTRPLWRHTSKSPEEATLWMAQTTASGMVPWYHWLGGSPEDLRWRKTGRDFFEWIASNEKWFVNRRSIANVGVVFSQQPGNDEFLQGLYYAMLEGRFVFDFVHLAHLDDIGRYAAVVLPNVKGLDEKQARTLAAYAKAGGSLLGTFETARGNRAVMDLFGIASAGDVQGPNGNGYYARIESPHEIWRDFAGTRVLPGAENRLRITAPGAPLLSVIEPYPAYPPESVYTTAPRTDEPAIVLGEHGRSRTAYLPGDIERSFWRSNNGDLGKLLANTLRWLTRGRAPVEVSGPGVIETFAWETDSGIAIHLLNYTNPNMLRGWFRDTFPVGPQFVRTDLPADARVSAVKALRAGIDLKFQQRGRRVEFEVPKVSDYEIAAVTL